MSTTKTQQHSGRALKISECDDMKCALSRAYDLGYEDVAYMIPARLGKDLLWYVRADVMSPPRQRVAVKAAYTAGRSNKVRKL